MNPRLEPIDAFLRRHQDYWLRRADNAQSEEVRQESEAEALALDDLIGVFGRCMPR